ncbi:MAG: PQQ-dependent sugar dehydrogenase [Dehalococcoidia bacterium]
MNRPMSILLLTALLAAVAAGCAEGEPSSTPTATPSATPVAPSPTPTPAGEPRLEVLVADADFPVALAFAPDGRLLYNELRSGRIRIVEDGELQPEPFATLEVQNTGEHGLLGLAIDPEFRENRYVYAFFSVPAADGSPLEQRVVRFTEVNGRGTAMTVVLDDLPIGASIHNGGRIAFGPDGKLYVSIGDTNRPETAQDTRALSGKILRYNPDGSIPADNPMPGSPLFALGLRNPFGIAFRPGGELFASENGPSGHDELNRVMAGANYGWPRVMGIAGDPRFVDPIFETGEGTLAPTGLTFYSGDLLSFGGDLFFCSFVRATLFRVRAADIDRALALPGASAATIDTGQPCGLDVKTGPDGALYLSDTENIYRWGP